MAKITTNLREEKLIMSEKNNKKDNLETKIELTAEIKKMYLDLIVGRCELRRDEQLILAKIMAMKFPKLNKIEKIYIKNNHNISSNVKFIRWMNIIKKILIWVFCILFFMGIISIALNSSAQPAEETLNQITDLKEWQNKIKARERRLEQMEAELNKQLQLEHAKMQNFVNDSINTLERQYTLRSRQDQMAGTHANNQIHSGHIGILPQNPPMVASRRQHSRGIIEASPILTETKTSRDWVIDHRGAGHPIDKTYNTYIIPPAQIIIPKEKIKHDVIIRDNDFQSNLTLPEGIEVDSLRTVNESIVTAQKNYAEKLNILREKNVMDNNKDIYALKINFQRSLYLISLFLIALLSFCGVYIYKAITFSQREKFRLETKLLEGK